jgi:nicotinamide-nucleotide amidase
VPPSLIEAHGAVSAEVAEAMARGGLENSRAEIAVAITGVAGPGGGTAAKPVGLVHFACAREDGKIELHHEIFPGDRAAVREASVLQALNMVARAAG